MRCLNVTILFALPLAIGLTLVAQPRPAEAGVCNSLGFSNKCVVRRDIDRNAINSGRVKDESLTGADIKDGTIDADDLDFAPATAREIDNLAHLQASDAAAYVFTTSRTYTGNLGGVAGADAKCQDLADQAGLPGIYFA